MLLKNLTFVAIALCCVGTSIAQPPASGAVTPDEASVRADFERRLEAIRKRIDAAEMKLESFKSELSKRQANAEKLIAARLKELQAASQSANEAPDEDDSVSAKMLSREGWQAWQKQDYRTALRKFEGSLKKDSSDANTWNGLGWTRFGVGEHEKATEAFEKALAIDPAQAGALNGIGQALIAQGQLDKAEKRLLIATKSLIDQHGEATVVSNGMTASWYGLTSVLIQRGNAEEAVRWANLYLQHKPDDAQFKGLLKQAQAIKK